MRSFNFRTSLAILAVAASAIAAPVGAYAGQSGDHGVMDASPSARFEGTRVEAILNQVKGIDQGIADARQGKTLTASEAANLRMRANAITRAAERTAAMDHDRLPAAQFGDLMQRVDTLDQSLLSETGVAPTVSG